MRVMVYVASVGVTWFKSHRHSGMNVGLAARWLGPLIAGPPGLLPQVLAPLFIARALPACHAGHGVRAGGPRMRLDARDGHPVLPRRQRLPGRPPFMNVCRRILKYRDPRN